MDGLRLIRMTKPGGLVSPDASIIVYDKDKAVFYAADRKPGEKSIRFNLPRGVFYTAGNFGFCQLHRWQLPKLPPKEKNEPLPKSAKVIVKENPSKCSVARKDGVMLIWIDPEISALPMVRKVPIIAHEIAHTWYYSEPACDIWAAWYLLKNGWNKSQLDHAHRNNLSDCETSKHRKEHLSKALK